MDVKRVESIAVPTALATVGGAVTGYMIPKMTKNGEITDEFVKYIADSQKAKDEKLIKTADSLDKITFKPSKEELDVINAVEDAGKRSELLAKATEKAKANGDKELERFVTKNAKKLGIEVKEGESLKDAVKKFVEGKSVEEIKEKYLSAAEREKITKTDYVKLVRESFEKVFDKATKKFKPDAGNVDVNDFKNFARKMKLKSAAKLGAITGAIALISATIANRISNR